MGVRYILSLECYLCGATDDDVYFAPTCDITSFVCKNCGTTNDINEDFVTVPHIKVDYLAADEEEW